MKSVSDYWKGKKKEAKNNNKNVVFKGREGWKWMVCQLYDELQSHKNIFNIIVKTFNLLTFSSLYMEARYTKILKSTNKIRKQDKSSIF